MEKSEALVGALCWSWLAPTKHHDKRATDTSRIGWYKLNWFLCRKIQRKQWFSRICSVMWKVMAQTRLIQGRIHHEETPCQNNPDSPSYASMATTNRVCLRTSILLQVQQQLLQLSVSVHQDGHCPFLPLRTETWNQVLQKICLIFCTWAWHFGSERTCIDESWAWNRTDVSVWPSWVAMHVHIFMTSLQSNESFARNNRRIWQIPQ